MRRCGSPRTAPPEVKFTAIGNVDVDRQGVWSSVVGALGTAFATSPEDAAWERPTSEIARSTGGPLIHCPTQAAAKP